MAMGLQRKNAILRNELRHLKRKADDDSASHARHMPSRDRSNERGDGAAMKRGANTR